ncbi:S-layer homology domain [Peptoniphilus harei]|uniref:S-layer homology domain-containing protein n=1 Tax=Peptoniphilus harei TaxID=54005 RepID=UPI000F6B8FDB|nr:S-layer homology domain-containing protein [Peptoniphilus harei]QQE47281.1 S-layer homology domain-containing protein [Peptoniphilus harei]VEJ34178.1 S-layer homology domain [Peptoniphilus harei]
MKSNNLKRAAALGLAALMLAPSATFAKEFKDVKKKNNKYSWAYDAIDILSDKNVISGHPDGEFKPGESVSLEELLQLIKQVLRPSDEEIKNATTKYSKMAKDNGVNKWAEEAVCLALDRGYLDENSLKKANERGFFKISQREYPSRGDIAIFFARALQLSPNGNTNLLKHNDKDKLSDTLKGYLSSLVEAKIFTATGSDGNFEGDRPITRAETAIITKASFDYAEKNKIEAKTEKMKGTVVLSSKLNNVNVVIIENKGTKYSFDIDNNTKYKLKDKDIKLEDIKAGQEVEIEYTKAKTGEREGTAKTITVTNAMLDMVGYVNSKGNNQITLRYRDNSDSLNFRTTSKISTSDTKTFDLDKNVKIKAYGKDLKLEDIAVDDLVEFKTNADNKITEITVFPKEAQVSGKIISLDTSNKDKAYLKIRLKDNKDYELYITSETKDLDKITLNDNVNLYVNYKVVRGLASNYNNGDVSGEVISYSGDESSFTNRRYNRYINIRTKDGYNKSYYLADRYEIKTYSGARQTQVTEDYLRGKNVILTLDKYGDVEIITIVDSNLQFSGMFQVVSTVDVGYNYNIYKIGLRVIQSDNEKLKPGKTLYFQTSQKLDLYDVLSFDGYLNSDGEIISDSNNSWIGNPRQYLNTANRVTRKSDFEDYRYFLNSNRYNNSGNSESLRNIGQFN